MKIAVVGSRSFYKYSLMKKELDKYDEPHIISGGAKGADSLAQKYAKDNGLKITIYYPNWDKHGKKAGFIRNSRIVHNCDRVIAFWDGKSKGTKNTIKKAKENHKILEIINYGKDSEQVEEEN